jgi:hypothetical protein
MNHAMKMNYGTRVQMSDRNPAALLRATVFGCLDGWLAGEPVWPLDQILQAWGPEFRM